MVFLKTLGNNIPSLLCYCHCYIQLSFRLGSHYTLGHYVRHTHLLAGHIPKERYYFCIQWKSMTDVYTKCSGQTWCEHSLPLTGLIVTSILPGLFSIYFTERQRHNCCVQQTPILTYADLHKGVIPFFYPKPEVGSKGMGNIMNGLILLLPAGSTALLYKETIVAFFQKSCVWNQPKAALSSSEPGTCCVLHVKGSIILCIGKM